MPLLQLHRVAAVKLSFVLFMCSVCNYSRNRAESRIDGGSKRRRKSFFINGANKAKTIVLQIRGLMDKVCQRVAILWNTGCFIA
jgi:hypothetical protein